MVRRVLSRKIFFGREVPFTLLDKYLTIKSAQCMGGRGENPPEMFRYL